MIAYTQRDTLGRETAVTNLRLDLKGVDQVPEWIFSLSNLQEMHLFNARFGRLHFSDWPWPRLEKLKWINCGLTVLSGSAPTSLHLLDLSDNPGLDWPAAFLEQSPELEALHFSRNNLLSAQLSGLEQLSRLRMLVLDGNQLSAVPKAVFQLSRLRVLDISHNTVSRIPSQIGQLQELDQLLAAGNKIKTLPDSIGELSALSHLQLNRNRLSTLPENMQHCLMLRKLELRNNKFSAFPAFLHQLPWLAELDLAHNQLSTLPADPGDFSQLSKLDLSYNKLCGFPFRPDQLPKLWELKLDHNLLHDLPPLPPTLFSLGASGNQLTHVPAGLLQLPGLRELFLERNLIGRLPQDFGKLKSSLIRLGMRGNPVQVEPGSLLPLRELKEISGLMPAARQKQLLLAQQTARSLDLPPELAAPFLQLLQSDWSILPTLSPEGILAALNHPVPRVAARVRRFVQKQYGLPVKGHSLKKGSILGIAGRTFFDKTRLEERLSPLQIELLPEYDPERCTHLLLGFPQLTQAIPPARQVILTEKQLALRMDQLEKKPLLREKSDARLKRLQQLLTSPDTTNIQLGFRMIKGNGLPPSLWNELLAAYYLSERDPPLQLQIKSYLRLRLEDEGKNKFFAALTPQLIKWGKIKPEKEMLLRRNRFDLERVVGYLK